MCGNGSIRISGGSCGSSTAAYGCGREIVRGIGGCGGSTAAYGCGKEIATGNVRCGNSPTIYKYDETTERSVVDEFNEKREAKIKTLVGK